MFNIWWEYFEYSNQKIYIYIMKFEIFFKVLIFYELVFLYSNIFICRMQRGIDLLKEYII